MMTNDELPIEAGVFEFRGADRPLWIWVKTCETPDCDCREVLVVASWRGRDELLLTARSIAEAMRRGSSFKEVIENAKDGELVFGFSFDSGEAINFGDPSGFYDNGVPPEFAEIVERIDGDTLDDIGRLWARGKGQPNLEMTERTPSQIHGWMPGDLLGWTEAFYGARTDYYGLDDDLFIATEYYCVTPGCDCRDRCVAFRRTGDHGREPVGRVRVPALGDVKLESEPGCGRTLRGLWDSYQRRYPSYRERLDRRTALMQAWGSRYVPPLLEQKTERVARTPGPNEPCSCGSGKKYKKCCWKKAMGAVG